MASARRGVRTAPFYAINMAPSLLVSCGGIRVNGKLQVTDKDYTPISGLYDIGMEASGLYGDTYNRGRPGHGQQLRPRVGPRCRAPRDQHPEGGCHGLGGPGRARREAGSTLPWTSTSRSWTRRSWVRTSRRAKERRPAAGPYLPCARLLDTGRRRWRWVCGKRIW